MDKQKLEEARQLAMSMTSHPVAFGTIEHTEKAGELLGLLCAALDAFPDAVRLLRECETTLEMWADVAPAVSLRADIRNLLARVA